MKKIALMTALVMALCIAPSAYAQDWTWNVGGGLNYAFEAFNWEDGQAISTDNTWGANAKVGVMYDKMIGFELQYDYLNNFEASEHGTDMGVPYTIKMELQVQTIMLDVKWAPNLGSDVWRPYLIGGLGYMMADASVKVAVGNFTPEERDNDSEMCGEIGLGLDYFLNDNWSLGIEGVYTVGFNDLDDLRYFNTTLGFAYHW